MSCLPLLLCLVQSIWIVFTECGYYHEYPIDLCSYKTVEYISGQSSRFSCHPRINVNDSNAFYILQNIYNDAMCSGNITHQIVHECSDGVNCHCSSTASGYDCDIATVRTEDFDFDRHRCDPRSYAESVMVINECIHGHHGQYACAYSALSFDTCAEQNQSGLDLSLHRPALLPQPIDEDFDSCVRIQCLSDYNAAKYKRDSKTENSAAYTCVPSNVCQNEYSEWNGNSSWKYLMAEFGTKNKLSYDGLDCVDDLLIDMSALKRQHPQHDIISNECRSYVKVRQFEVDQNQSMDCNQSGSRGMYEYDWQESLWSLGCHSFWFNNYTKHSVKRTCTNSSVSVEKYTNAHCGGYPYGHFTIQDGCHETDIVLRNETYPHLSFIDVITCGQQNCGLQSRLCLFYSVVLTIMQLMQHFRP